MFISFLVLGWTKIIAIYFIYGLFNDAVSIYNETMHREENFSLAILNNSQKPRRPPQLLNILHIISGLENELQHVFSELHMHLMHVCMDYLNPSTVCLKTCTKIWQELLHCPLTSHWFTCKRTYPPIFLHYSWYDVWLRYSPTSLPQCWMQHVWM